MNVIYIAAPLLILLIAVVITELRAPEPWLAQEDKPRFRKPADRE